MVVEEDTECTDTVPVDAGRLTDNPLLRKAVYADNSVVVVLVLHLHGARPLDIVYGLTDLGDIVVLGILTAVLDGIGDDEKVLRPCLNR